MDTIVALHAHPDDEALLTGGWLAQRSAAGDRVILVLATDGAAGLTGSSEAGTPLGVQRRAELLRAAAILGVARVVWLDYADSGMAAAPSAARTRFIDVPILIAARRVAAILDEEGATVLTGYDAHGGYGHPDHVQVHRVAQAAQALARRRPALWEATLDRTWLVRSLRLVRPMRSLLPGMTLPGDEIYSDRAEIDVVVDVRPQWGAKRSALAAHASQTTGGVRTLAVLLALPRPVARRVLGYEYFRVRP
ncbi:PIG-L family deacetylase [Nocardioides sp. BP30]|uniref:PIG-L deacetylase family protein n=1 Tax=Nocardioides sp. BP30 TaxID=3036374 RepID=UPI002468A20D|nr:PIG-L family deacetylase [Nocardioides sp. BP30]WGL52500.1 PIG-L family deacetylase [Nocardioides sp. BP30]